MTRIVDLLGSGAPTLSFEFSPPKTDEAEVALAAVLDELAPIAPVFISVTYGALGSTRDRTRDVVIRFENEHPFPTMAHLTCVGHSKPEVVDLLDAYAAGGVENILALGGDPPADGSDPGGDFAHAIELVELVRAHPGRFSVGVAAHPEKHPRSPSVESDRGFLADKLAAADFAITQFFFTLDPYLRLVDELSALGCTKPVLPGVFPFINVAGARRMSAINEATIPPALSAAMDEADRDPGAVAALGVEVATDLAIGLLDAGVRGLHLYTMNRSGSVLEVVDQLGLR